MSHTVQAQTLACPITRIRLAGAIAPQLTEPLGYEHQQRYGKIMAQSLAGDKC